MRKISLPVLVCVVLASGVSWFDDADADIRKTKHNFIASANQPMALHAFGGALVEGEISGPREVCVFCHTPTLDGTGGLDDGLGTSGIRQPVALPSWQRSAKAGDYTLYDDIGRNSRQKAVAIGSISVACLSCHDSNQALGVMPDEYNHPFNVPYRGMPIDKANRQEIVDSVVAAGEPIRVASYVLSDPDFQPARRAVVNLNEIWWVPRGESPVRTKEDLPVYPRRIVMGNDSYTVPFIECTSCHDPHVERETFLRVENAGSQLCLTCHIK